MSANVKIGDKTYTGVDSMSATNADNPNEQVTFNLGGSTVTGVTNTVSGDNLTTTITNSDGTEVNSVPVKLPTGGGGKLYMHCIDFFPAPNEYPNKHAYLNVICSDKTPITSETMLDFANKYIPQKTPFLCSAEANNESSIIYPACLIRNHELEGRISFTQQGTVDSPLYYEDEFYDVIFEYPEIIVNDDTVISL